VGLEFLNISHNRVRQLLIDRHFSYEKLETLDVSHNLLSSIDPLLTQNLPVLSTLILSNNRLEFRSRQEFSPNAKLANVFLDANPISWLNLDIFENFTRLTWLGLSNCENLRFLTGGSKSLTKLSIGNGSIRKLPQDFLMNNPAIQEMDISQNNWTCNCNLAWLSLKGRLPLIKLNETFCLAKNSSEKVDMGDFLMTAGENLRQKCQFGTYAENGAKVWERHGRDAIIGITYLIFSNLDLLDAYLMILIFIILSYNTIYLFRL